MEQLKLLLSNAVIYVLLVKALNQSQVPPLQLAVVVEVQDTNSLDKDHSRFNKFAETVMARVKLLEILACK